MTKQITHRKETPVKKRSQTAYQKKVDRIIAWYNRLLELRKKDKGINPHNKLPYKRAELKDLDFYIDKIKKASN